MSEYGRGRGPEEAGRDVADWEAARKSRRGGGGESRIEKETEIWQGGRERGRGRENNVASPGAACVILAEQSPPNATLVVAGSGFRPVKMVDRLPSYLTQLPYSATYLPTHLPQQCGNCEVNRTAIAYPPAILVP